MNINELNSLIIEWAKERELDTKGTVEAQAIKTVEELSELIKAVCKDDKEEIIDAIGDVYVTLVIGNMLNFNCDMDNIKLIKNVDAFDSKKSLLSQISNACKDTLDYHYQKIQIVDTINVLLNVCITYKLDFVDCVESAYNTIKDRHGKLIDGMYVKDEDLASGAAQKATREFTNDDIKNFTNCFTDALY